MVVSLTPAEVRIRKYLCLSMPILCLRMGISIFSEVKHSAKR